MIESAIDALGRLYYYLDRLVGEYSSTGDSASQKVSMYMND